mmetsp:Transcript_5803/g.7838  ORF Transcript_5803/g.7838 Transcript_5803/m.7838 type:complete len:266 (-) Transcript_5803:517-1314(-)
MVRHRIRCSARRNVSCFGNIHSRVCFQYTFGSQHITLIIHESADHQNYKPSKLKKGVFVEPFTESRGGEVKEVAVDGPHEECAQRLENGPKHRPQVVRDAHPAEVVHEHGECLRDDNCVDDRRSPDELDGVQRVLLPSPHVRSGQVVDRGHHDTKHEDHTVQAFESNHLQGLEVEVAHEIVLEGELDRLHHLRNHHQAHAKQHSLRGFSFLLASSAQERRASNTRDAHNREADAGEVHKVQLPLQKHNGKDGRKHQLGPPQHLVH